MLKGGIGAGLDVRFATVTAATGRVTPAVSGLGTATPLRLTVAAAVRVAGVGNLCVMGRLGSLHILRPGGTHRDNIVQPFDDNPLLIFSLLLIFFFTRQPTDARSSSPAVRKTSSISHQFLFMQFFENYFPNVLISQLWILLMFMGVDLYVILLLGLL